MCLISLFFSSRNGLGGIDCLINKMEMRFYLLLHFKIMFHCYVNFVFIIYQKYILITFILITVFCSIYCDHCNGVHLRYFANRWRMCSISYYFRSSSASRTDHATRGPWTPGKYDVVCSAHNISRTSASGCRNYYVRCLPVLIE
jgi:hypothetical protein